MYPKDDVELALLAVREGMSRREVAEPVGCGEAAVRNRAAGRLPRSCAPSSRIPGEGRAEGARIKAWAREDHVRMAAVIRRLIEQEAVVRNIVERDDMASADVFKRMVERDERAWKRRKK